MVSSTVSERTFLRSTGRFVSHSSWGNVVSRDRQRPFHAGQGFCPRRDRTRCTPGPGNQPMVPTTIGVVALAHEDHRGAALAVFGDDIVQALNERAREVDGFDPRAKSARYTTSGPTPVATDDRRAAFQPPREMRQRAPLRPGDGRSPRGCAPAPRTVTISRSAAAAFIGLVYRTAHAAAKTGVFSDDNRHAQFSPSLSEQNLLCDSLKLS
jgi:hypothetical protein